MSIDVMKSCCACKQLKPFDQFSKDKKAKDGHCYRCKPCSKEQNHIWYMANRERLIKLARANELANPERAKQKKRDYAARHPDRKKESQRKYEAKPEVRARMYADPRRKAWQKQHREKVIGELHDEYVRRVMAQRLSITGSQIPQVLVDAQREVMKIKRSLNENR